MPAASALYRVFVKSQKSVGEGLTGFSQRASAGDVKPESLLLVPRRLFFCKGYQRGNAAMSDKKSASKPITDESILRVAKEVVLKFIEVRRVSPENFGELFASIYRSIHDTVRDRQGDDA